MSQRSTPIVPTFFTIGTRKKPYELAPITRYKALYATPTTVRGQPGKGQAETIQQAAAYCLPDDPAWQRATEAHEALRLAVAALGDELRRLGTYRQRLKEAGGFKKAPNPLSPTVISADEPDGAVSWWFEPTKVSKISRVEIERHTPEMLREKNKDYTGTNQTNHIVCPTDDDWEVVDARYQAAVQAEEIWNSILKELGTYREASADGRYANRPPAPIPAEEHAAPAPRASDFAYGSLVIWTNANGAEILGRVTTCFSGKKLAIKVPPDNAVPRYVDPARCRPAPGAAERDPPQQETTPMAPLTKTTAAARGIWHNLPPALAGYTWVGEQKDATRMPTAQLRAPDGWVSGEYEGGNNGAIAEALRRVRGLAVVEPPLSDAAAVIASSDDAGPGALVPISQVIEPIVMMDAAESRETLAAIRTDLDAAETSERSARRRLLDWKERDGWKALGYGSFVAGVQAEIGPWGKAHIYRLVGAAQVERLLGLDQSPVGDSPEVPERQLRKLATLLDEPEALHAAWDRAGELAEGGERTTAHVERAVAEQRPAPPPARPNAPAGWVWRDNNSMRRIADNATAGPYARLADVVSAAELLDRERDDAYHVAQARAILADLPAWDSSQYELRYREAYVHARAVRDPERRRAIFAEIDGAVERMSAPAPVAPAQAAPSQRLGPGQSEPAPWPEAPEGWRWNRRGVPAHLIAPDGWTTHDYNYPERALAEAERRILSQPKAPAQPVADPLAPDRQALLIARTHLDIARESVSPAQIRQQISDARKQLYQVGDELAPQRQALEQEAASLLAELDGRAAPASDRNEVPPQTAALAPTADQPLTRPVRPASGDASAVLEYLRALERYADAEAERQQLTVARTHLEIAAKSGHPRETAERLRDAWTILKAMTTHSTEQIALEREYDRIRAQQHGQARASTDLRYHATEILSERLKVCDELLIRLLARGLDPHEGVLDVWEADLGRHRHLIAVRLFEESYAAEPERTQRLFAPVAERQALAGAGDRAIFEQMLADLEQRAGADDLGAEELAACVATLEQLDDRYNELLDELDQAEAQQYSDRMDRLQVAFENTEQQEATT